MARSIPWCALRLNPGDVWILVAMVIYGIYAAMFRRRPNTHPMSFLVATMGIGSVMILPFYLWEFAAGGRIQGGVPVWLAMAYMAIFPSFIAYLFFNRGIELVGATRAGQSWHLMPLFGSILAVAFLGETFHTYHAVGIALIGAGILLASVKPVAGAAGLFRPQQNVKARRAPTRRSAGTHQMRK